VAGTPQGLAVYQKGGAHQRGVSATPSTGTMIPTAAIRSVSVVTNNPAFGLIALAGRSCADEGRFQLSRRRGRHDGGSFGRIQSSANGASRSDGNFAVYGALEGRTTTVFGIFRPPTSPLLRRCRLQERRQRIHCNMGVADNKFGAAATTPVELLTAILGRDLHHAADLQ